MVKKGYHKMPDGSIMMGKTHSDMVSVKITKSTNPKKKYMAVFDNYGKKKTTHFGAAGMSDYTKHKDNKRKELYLKRHKKRENWDKYMTAGSLSRYILWGETTLKKSIDEYKKKFRLL
tara:strand:+ start:141 stop:494 length:354 start_codon:yes stop_codon:yes gene_type:complete